MSKEANTFFAALLTCGDSGELLKLGKVEEVFKHIPSEQEQYKFIQDYVHKYGELPRLKTFNEKFNKKLKKNTENIRYLHDQLFDRHVKKTMIKAAQEANEFIIGDDPLKGYQIMKKAMDELEINRSSAQIFDFKESHDLLKHELVQKAQPDYGINTGWELFDGMNGALRGGDLISVVGRSGLGKTWLLLFMALYAWERNRKPILFFTMEMDPLLIIERLASMFQHIPYNWVKHGEFTTLKGNNRKKFLKNMAKLGDSDMPPFHIIGGNLATTINEIILISKQLGPQAVFVDGAYLVRTDKGFSKHEKIGNVANSLKRDVAAELEIPVITSWQFSREVTKLKKGQKAGTEHIGGTDEIGNVSSIVLGLFQEESSSTLRQRRVEIVKGRGGESGEFFINWDFKNMDFNQVPEIKDYKIMKT